MKNIKKYIVWFIIWIMSAGAFTYAADNGSIWSLFEQLWTGEWVLDWSNIKDSSVWEVKLDTSLWNKINQITTNQNNISDINSKIDLGNNWTIVPNWNNLEFKFNWTTKITFASDWSITATQYNLN